MKNLLNLGFDLLCIFLISGIFSYLVVRFFMYLANLVVQYV